MTVSLIGLAAASVGAILTYLGAARRLSGKINTSEAEQLWSEARAIRDDYREQLGEATKRTVELENRVAALERKNGELANENAALRQQVREDAQLIARLQAQADEQDRTIAELRTHVGALQANQRTETP